MKSKVKTSGNRTVWFARTTCRLPQHQIRQKQYRNKRDHRGWAGLSGHSFKATSFNQIIARSALNLWEMRAHRAKKSKSCLQEGACYSKIASMVHTRNDSKLGYIVERYEGWRRKETGSSVTSSVISNWVSDLVLNGVHQQREDLLRYGRYYNETGIHQKHIRLSCSAPSQRKLKQVLSFYFFHSHL